MKRKILLTALITVLFSSVVSAQDVFEAPGADVSGDTLTLELENHESGWATLALPVNGEVPLEQVTDDCDLQNEVAYGYEGQGTSTETINGMRGYAIQLENSCTAEIQTSSIEGNLDTSLPDNGWTVLSVPAEMSADELESNCDFNGHEGTNIFEITLEDGNIPLESSDTLEGTGLYWIRVTGNDCVLDLTDQPFNTPEEDSDDDSDEGSDSSVPSPDIGLSDSEVLERDYAPMEIPEDYEKDIDLPECDSSQSDVRIMQPEDDLDQAFADEETRVYCLTPGSYGGGDVWDNSGTAEEPNWIRYYNPEDEQLNNLHPWNQANPEIRESDERVYIEGIYFRDPSHWRIDGIRFGNELTMVNVTDFVVNEIMMYRNPSEVQVQIKRSDDVTVQNSVLGKNNVEDWGTSDVDTDSNSVSIQGADSNAGGGHSNDIHIVNNELFDFLWGDGVQSLKTDCDGLVVQNNDIYTTEEFNSESNNWVENGVDFKCGPADPETGSLENTEPSEWGLVENNRLWGVGSDIIMHWPEVSGITIRNNKIWDINQFAYAVPAKEEINREQHFYDNILYQTGGGLKPRHIDDSLYARNILVRAEGEDNTWSWFSNPENNLVTQNVFVENDVGNAVLENDVRDNAFYSSETFDGGDPAFEEEDAASANHEDLSIEVRPFTGPETVTLSDAGVTEDSPHSGWFR